MQSELSGETLIQLVLNVGIRTVADMFAQNLGLVETVLNLFIKEIVNEVEPDLNYDYDRPGVLAGLLEAGFFELRVSVERRRPKAVALMERLQAIVARDIVRAGKNPDARALIMDALKEARVEFMPVLKSAVAKHPVDMLSDSEDLLTLDEAKESLTSAIHQFMSAYKKNIFTVAREILNTSEGLSAQQCKNSFMMLFTLKNLDTAQEMCVFFMLDQRPEIRQFALQNFATANPRMFSGDFLRRLTTICYWLPDKEKKLADSILKDIRNVGTQSTALPKPEKIQFIATGVDGSGSWGIVGIGKSEKRNWQFGFLCRIGDGIRDVWVMDNVTSVKNKSLTNQCKIQRMLINGKMTIDDFVVLMNHGIAAELKSGRLPSFDVLEILELLGVSENLNSFVSFEDEIARIRNKYSCIDETKDQKNKTLEFKALSDNFIFDSWFEDDIEVDEIVDSICIKKSKRSAVPMTLRTQAMKKIISDVVLKRVTKWSECFQMIAYLSEHLKSSEYPAASECIELSDRLLAGTAEWSMLPLYNIGMKSVVASLSRND